MRICCLNNYPLDKMIEMAERGLMPGQHGWGVQHLQAAGQEVRLAPYAHAGDRVLLDRASTFSRHVLGQLDQELWALRQRPDVYYAADQHSLAGIAMARGLLAPRSRLISVVHHPMTGRRARARTAAVRAHDAIVTLNPALCHELTAAGVHARLLDWGPDLGSPLYQDTSDTGFAVSTGKSNRDVATLVAALAKTGHEGTVFDLATSVLDAPPNVTLVRPGGAGADPAVVRGYLADHVLDITRRAGYVAIPISNPERLTGLTEINDALALGKPILMTRSRFTPVDIEAEGCGIVIEVGDVDGWAAAITALADPATRREMGANGRRFAERSWNYERFGHQLTELVRTIT